MWNKVINRVVTTVSGRDMTKSKEIALQEICDISRVDAFYQECCGVIDANGEVVISAAAVGKIDASFVQLLVAVNLYARENGVTVKVINPSEHFIHATKLTGADQILGL